MTTTEDRRAEFDELKRQVLLVVQGVPIDENTLEMVQYARTNASLTIGIDGLLDVLRNGKKKRMRRRRELHELRHTAWVRLEQNDAAAMEVDLTAVG